MKFKNQFSQIAHNKNFRHGALYTIFSFVNRGLSFILILILAHYLAPYDYGQLNLFTTFVTLVSLLIALCTTSYIPVSFFQKDIDTLRKIILIAFATTTIVAIAISAGILIFPGFTEKSIGVPLNYIWIGLLICYCQVFNSVNLDIWRLEERPISYGIYSISFALCNFIFTFWFIVRLHLGWEGRVYAWWMLEILYFVISLGFLIKRKYLVFTNPQIRLIKETLIYALPLLPHTISFWLKQGLDRYIINYFHDQTIVGYYSFAMNLASIIVIVGTAFNATNSVYIYKKLADGYDRVKATLQKQTKIMTVVFFIVSILVSFFAWILIHFFLQKYEDSIPYILPLCLGGFFQCIYLLWVNYLFFYKKTKELMHITLSTAILQVGLSLWLTRYSPLYTAYISMSIMVLTTILVYHRSKKELNLKLNNL